MNNRLIAKIGELATKTIEIIIDTLIPQEKEVKILEKYGPSGLYANIPIAENFDFETQKIKAIFNYKNSLCRQAIWEIKYRANKKLIRDFSLLLYEFILEDLSDLSTFKNFKKPILVPVPSSEKRKREKGFNQCVLITRELIKIDKERKENNFILVENLLIKTKDTPHQTKVSNRKKRLENLNESFSVNKVSPFFINTKNISDYSFIVIDDVITTSATMKESFRALKTAGFKKIIGYALAH